jgi:REP element-mobilizing transposase RayT
MIPGHPAQSPAKKIENGEMILNNAGNIAQQCWLDIPQHFPNVELHEYVVMPNHIHGIVEPVCV